MKRQYKYRIFEKTPDLFESRDALRKASKGMVQETIVLYVGHPPHFLDAAEVFNFMRGVLTSTLVKRCCKKAAILPVPMNAEIESDVGKNATASRLPKDELDYLVLKIHGLSYKAKNILVESSAKQSKNMN